ncbi:hypothetical protein [Zhouia amylolytica]|uniref:Uncharacterized protein n=1 Tax=Zhouia amylolytica AD3 TaxID=1286632 RepID=W2UL78_9FLAO|nr:hypothetical protein [Zhouia amylolytica]ETN94920.1 hypothetical protein P278_20780 [Zhouia amylolytica AD3]
MNDFRYRPKDDYIPKANWEELFVLTEHWQSDLEFYQDDLKFLNHLIDKYFIWLTDKKHIDKVRDLEVNLLEITKKCESLLGQTSKHLTHIEEIMSDPFTYDAQKFREEHQLLEDAISDFIKQFRKSRKAAFAITEYVIDSEKLSYLLKD